MRRRPLEFEVSDRVFLKAMPKRGVISSASAGSYRRGLLGLSRYSRGYSLCVPVSVTAQHVRCPRGVSRLHTLDIYTPDPAHVVDWAQIEVNTNGTCEEGPECIVCSRDQVLRRKTVRLVRVLWRHCGVEESTWEREDTMRLPIPSCLGMKVRSLVV